MSIEEFQYIQLTFLFALIMPATPGSAVLRIEDGVLLSIKELQYLQLAIVFVLTMTMPTTPGFVTVLCRWPHLLCRSRVSSVFS